MILKLKLMNHHLKPGVITFCFVLVSYMVTAQLYSNQQSISGNNVGINISSPSASLHIKERAGFSLGLPGQNNFTVVPLLKFQTTSGPGYSPVTQYNWTLSQDASSALNLKFQENSGAISHKYSFQPNKLLVKANEINLENKVQFAQTTGPQGIPSNFMALGLTNSQTVWTGSGSVLLSNPQGLYIATSSSGIYGVGQLEQAIRFNVKSTGEVNHYGPAFVMNVAPQLTGNNRKTKLIFRNPQQAGNNKDLFTIESTLSSDSQSPNMLSFMSKQQGGSAWFNMPVRIGGNQHEEEKITSAHKFYVAGGILAERVKVKTYANWPDYVFGEEYKLMPFNELREYIDLKHHLPGVPSADEVVEDGIELSEMNAKLLEKVEELTLYVLKLEERLKELEEKE